MTFNRGKVIRRERAAYEVLQWDGRSGQANCAGVDVDLDFKPLAKVLPDLEQIDYSTDAKKRAILVRGEPWFRPMTDEELAKVRAALQAMAKVGREAMR